MEVAEETREALRRSRAAEAAARDGGGCLTLMARTPGLMAIPTWDTYTPMLVKGGVGGEASWVRTPDIDRSDGERITVTGLLSFLSPSSPSVCLFPFVPPPLFSLFFGLKQKKTHHYRIEVQDKVIQRCICNVGVFLFNLQGPYS